MQQQNASVENPGQENARKGKVWDTASIACTSNNTAAFAKNMAVQKCLQTEET